MGFLVTCEHGSDRVPAAVAGRLGAIADADGFHCPDGYDVGARETARAFARRLDCPLVEAAYSPRLIDCNRPAHHRQLFSPEMRRAEAAERQRWIAEIHTPHQRRIRERIERIIATDGQAIQLAIHSFSPFEGGDLPPTARCESARRTDLGLLYDPARTLERDLCGRLFEILWDSLPMLRVRRNYPVRGTRGGILRSLRREFPADRYLGIELQFNQAWCARRLTITRQTVGEIITALAAAHGDRRRFAA